MHEGVNHLHAPFKIITKRTPIYLHLYLSSRRP